MAWLTRAPLLGIVIGSQNVTEGGVVAKVRTQTEDNELGLIEVAAGPAAEYRWCRVPYSVSLYGQRRYEGSDMRAMLDFAEREGDPYVVDYALDVAARVLAMPLVKQCGLHLAEHLRTHREMDRAAVTQYVAEHWNPHSEQLPEPDDIRELWAARVAVGGVRSRKW